MRQKRFDGGMDGTDMTAHNNQAKRPSNSRSAPHNESLTEETEQSLCDIVDISQMRIPKCLVR